MLWEGVSKVYYVIEGIAVNILSVSPDSVDIFFFVELVESIIMRQLSYKEKRFILAHDFGGSFPRLHRPPVVDIFMRTTCHYRHA